MAKRDDGVTLRQLLSHACEARDLSATKNRTDLDRERVLLLALVQLLQIVGEAAGRLSAGFQLAHPEVPWGAIVAFRNRGGSRD